ncbi:MAG: hypothetical protein ABSD49_14035 [Candidatus Bathyarchaeia archaeon]
MSRQALPHKQPYAKAIPVPEERKLPRHFRENISVPDGWRCPECGKPGYPYWFLVPRTSGNGLKGPYLAIGHGSGHVHRDHCYIRKKKVARLNLPPPRHLHPDPPSSSKQRRNTKRDA